jgi:ABC-type transport system involved in multi-copper enzyme maturation permease subunit
MWYCIRVIAGFTFKEAVRSRLFRLHLALLVVAIGLGEFIGAVAITESYPLRAALLGSLLRLYAVLSLTLFAAGSLAREWHDKGVQLVIALPYPRAAYFFGRLFGFLGVAVVTALLLSVSLLLYAPAPAVCVWLLSLICELAIVLTVTLVAATTWHQSASIAMSVLAFYVLARSMAAIQLIGHGPLSDPTSLGQKVLTHTLDTLAYLLPELHRYTLSEWLVYPDTALWQNLLPISLQTCIYIAFLCILGLFDFYRKSF